MVDAKGAYVVYKPYYIGTDESKWTTIHDTFENYNKALNCKEKLIDKNPHWENYIIIEELK